MTFLTYINQEGRVLTLTITAMPKKRKIDDAKSTQPEKKSKEDSYEARIFKLEGDFAPKNTTCTSAGN
jgi:hypothetical protein